MDLDYEQDAFTLMLRAGGRSEETIKTYHKAIKRFRSWLLENGHDPNDISLDRSHIEGYLAYLRDLGLGQATIAQHFRSLQQFTKFAAEENDEPNPTHGLKTPQVSLRPPDVLTNDQLRRLLSVCAGRTLPDRRDTALLSLFADTGLRRGEVASIQVQDLHIAERIVTVTGKTGTRTVAFGNTTALALTRYARERNKHPDAALPNLWLGRKGALTVFGIEQIVKRRAAQAGLKVNPHLFRHTFAHTWLDGGGNEGDLQRLAGWKSPAMIARYGASAAAARARRAYHQGRSPLDNLK